MKLAGLGTIIFAHHTILIADNENEPQGMLETCVARSEKGCFCNYTLSPYQLTI